MLRSVECTKQRTHYFLRASGKKAQSDRGFTRRNEMADNFTDIISKLGSDTLFGIKTNTIYTVIGFLSFLGNSIVVYVYVRVGSLRKNVANLFILNQACIDCASGVLLVLNCSTSMQAPWMPPWLQDLNCRMWLSKAPMWGLLLASTYNVLAVTVDRYFSVVRPFIHRHHFTRYRAKVAVCSVWTFGLGFNLAYMLPTSEIRRNRCYLYDAFPNLVIQRMVGSLVLFIQYLLPLVVICYSYQRIYQRLASCPGDQRSRVRRNVIRTLMLIAMCFVICWTPNQILYTMFNLGQTKLFTSPYFHVSVSLVYINGCCNSLIYVVSYDSFKKEAKRILIPDIFNKTTNNKSKVYTITS